MTGSDFYDGLYRLIFLFCHQRIDEGMGTWEGSGGEKEKGQMTLAHQVAVWLGLDPSPQQLGFLLCVVAAFIAGWCAKASRDKRDIGR